MVITSCTWRNFNVNLGFLFSQRKLQIKRPTSILQPNK